MKRPNENSAILSRRGFIACTLLAGCTTPSPPASGPRAPGMLGYTEYRTNLPTRYDNQITARACVVRADGTGHRTLAPSLVREPYTWTQFAGWSPDGRQAAIGRGWETPENGAWEEAHKTFRMTQGWRYDMYLLDMASRKLENLTAVERVSDYNAGLLFVPGGANKLGFTALIGGISHPFTMDRDGHHKQDLTQGKEGFSYGFSASPDGRFVAYHKDYHIFTARTDGSEAREIVTGNPFNFCPAWSPDGAWLLFVSGEHYDCHPYIVRADGTGLRKLASRGGYEGVTTVYDVFDFHDGSSDVPVWSADGACVFYTARAGEAIELMRVTLDGTAGPLTHSAAGVTHYHPKPSPDGNWIAYGSNATGTRQLYVMNLRETNAYPVTEVPAGHGAMWPCWRP